jgi:hypothetical protein
MDLKRMNQRRTDQKTIDQRRINQRSADHKRMVRAVLMAALIQLKASVVASWQVAAVVVQLISASKAPRSRVPFMVTEQSLAGSSTGAV